MADRGVAGGGAVLMLLVAGILEGGFRQLIANTEARFAIGGAHRPAVGSLFPAPAEAGVRWPGSLTASISSSTE